MFAKTFLFSFCSVLLAAQAWAFDEGIEYTTLPAPQPTETGDKIEVLEFFMFSCPHCFHLEPMIQQWLKTKPENVEFRRMPAVFGPKVEPHARAFYAAELLGVHDKFDVPLFRALHEQKRRIWDEDALVAFAAEQNIDPNEFRTAYNSFFVNMKVRRAEEMGKRYGVDGVPTFIINGKYRTSPSQTGSQGEMFQVIDELIRMESNKASAEEAAPAASSS